MLQRALAALFTHTMAAAETATFSLSVQFVEIYNEEIRDLLQPDHDPRDARISEQDGQMVLEGVCCERLGQGEEGWGQALALFHEGCRNRVTGGSAAAQGTCMLASSHHLAVCADVAHLQYATSCTRW